MFNSVLHRKRFSIHRNATKRWKKASGVDEPSELPRGGKVEKEPLSVVIRRTSMSKDQQKQAVEIANMALDTCQIESEIATYIKHRMDELTSQSWHVIVGRNFGSHVSCEQHIQFTAEKITILVYQIG